ncbi:MAG: polymer-forming cytoskeletal protein [Lachnospiraceae bacterium]|nr:polymer-forming cytoskeletal protein [Lachnospiraceae bacterium]
MGFFNDLKEDLASAVNELTDEKAEKDIALSKEHYKDDVSTFDSSRRTSKFRREKKPNENLEKEIQNILNGIDDKPVSADDFSEKPSFKNETFEDVGDVFANKETSEAVQNTDTSVSDEGAESSDNNQSSENGNNSSSGNANAGRNLQTNQNNVTNNGSETNRNTASNQNSVTNNGSETNQNTASNQNSRSDQETVTNYIESGSNNKDNNSSENTENIKESDDNKSGNETEEDMTNETNASASSLFADTKKDEYYDNLTLICEGTSVKGSIEASGSAQIDGYVEGDVKANGEVLITGTVIGNVEGLVVSLSSGKIRGNVKSDNGIIITADAVLIGDIESNEAQIAGAVKGKIDVNGPVILESEAKVLGDIDCKNVQINNGAVIEGKCSQKYAEVSPTAFFDNL